MYTIGNVIQTFNHSIAHTIQSHIYKAQFPLLSSPLASPPFAPPLCPLLLTWHPPAVTGIVHLSLRLLVNWPHLPHPSPSYPTPSKPQLSSAKQRRPREYSLSCYPEQLAMIEDGCRISISWLMRNHIWNGLRLVVGRPEVESERNPQARRNHRLSHV